MQMDTLLPTRELAYVLLLFVLFVVPRALQRYRLPTAVTSFGLGAGAGLGLGWFVHDPTIQLLSTLGIVSLFLFAGLDVDLDELRARGTIVLQHVIVRLLAVAAVAATAAWTFRIDIVPAMLIGLALITPSTGFILDSLASMGVNEEERFWIRSKAVATELVALGVLFVALQAQSSSQLALSGAVLVAMTIGPERPSGRPQPRIRLA